MLMPFGKFKGTEVSELPPAYLKWLAESLSLYGPLAQAVQCALNGEPEPDEEPQLEDFFR